MTTGLLTTSVGSFPKSPYLLQARNRAAQGKMDQKELHELELKATKEWIQFQEELGIDILVDGEQYRGDMVTYFAEEMEGFGISGLVRSYGNRYYRKPVATGPVARKSAITVDMYKYSQGLTSRPVKGMLTGPYTMVDWSFNEYYPTREAFVMAMAEVVHQEAADLEKAGAKYIQIDEPAVSTRPDEMELAARAMAVVTKGLSAFTITHICYGDFASVFDKLIAIPVDQFDLEMANSGYDLLDLLKGKNFTKTLAMGVVDVHNHAIESLEEVKASIRRGLEALPAERLYIDPDCGLKTRTVEEAKDKMRVIAQAVKEVKAELRIE
ncbi:MAG: methionine synthase [Dehalococcoidia bacterium]|nr:methionine synthase [Dehalococcoidia bacterium]